MRRVPLVLLAIFLATLPALRGQTTVSFTPSQDVRIIGTSGLDNNNYYGGSVITAFRNNAQPNLQHGLAQFDISSLSNVAVASATLTLNTVNYPNQNNGNSGGATEIYRVGELWLEEQVTWNTRTDGVAWSTPGGGFLGTGGGSLTSPFATNSTLVAANEIKALTFDVTSLVQGWIDGSYPNYGFGLVPGADQVRLAFYPMEQGGILQPSLSITYSAIPEPSTYAAIFGALALGAAGLRRSRRRLAGKA